MKFLKNINLFSILVVMALLVVSCSKENIDKENTKEGEVITTTTTEGNALFGRSSGSETGLDLDCIEVTFPFDVVDTDGGMYTISAGEDLTALVEDSVAIIDFVYPLDVTTEDGEELSVADGEALAELFASCLPNEWNVDLFPAYLISETSNCLDLVYPISLVDIDGNITSVDNEEDFIAALAEEQLFFSFPVTLTDGEEETVVNNGEEMIVALFDCNDFDVDSTQWNSDFEFLGCYTLEFPFDVMLEDGTTVTVEDHMQYCDLLLQGDVVGFGYPLTLTDEDGETIIVNSEEELNELFENCWGDGGGPNFGGDATILYLAGNLPSDSTGTFVCLTIQYPLDLDEISIEDGTVIQTVTVNSNEEFAAVEGLLSGEAIYNVVYPVTIVLNETGENIILEGFEDLLDVLSNCQ